MISNERRGAIIAAGSSWGPPRAADASGEVYVDWSTFGLSGDRRRVWVLLSRQVAAGIEDRRGRRLAGRSSLFADVRRVRLQGAA
jgi:hypothetical protein